MLKNIERKAKVLLIFSCLVVLKRDVTVFFRLKEPSSEATGVSDYIWLGWDVMMIPWQSTDVKRICRLRILGLIDANCSSVLNSLNWFAGKSLLPVMGALVFGSDDD